MKNQKLFDRTVGILVKAYFENTLAHNDCIGCAVGNLVCANMYGFDRAKWDADFSNNFGNNWSDVFLTSDGQQEIHERQMRDEALEQIKSTGYDLYELASIEKAFESADGEDNSDEHMYNGLMAVCDALMTIHEANNEEITAAKSLFKKELAEIG